MKLITIAGCEHLTIVPLRKDSPVVYVCVLCHTVMEPLEPIWSEISLIVSVSKEDVDRSWRESE